MRKAAIIMTLLIFTSIAGVGCADDSGSAKNTIILSINDIQSDPLAFTGALTINGVTAVFSEDDPMVFGIKDTAELLFCRDLYCDAFTLPARYVGDGPMPVLADEVDVVGSWGEYEGRFILEVTEISVKRNIMPILIRSGGAQ